MSKKSMWNNVKYFLAAIRPKEVGDVTWKYNSKGAVEKIIIKFEHPIYLQENTDPRIEN